MYEIIKDLAYARADIMTPSPIDTTAIISSPFLSQSLSKLPIAYAATAPKNILRIFMKKVV